MGVQKFFVQDPKADWFYITWPLHYLGHLSFFIGCLVILATRTRSPKVLSLLESMYGINMAASTDNVLPEFQ